MPTGTDDDPRPLFFRAADQVQRAVSGVRATQLAQPTPCAEFDVRALLGHLLSVFRRVGWVAGGGDGSEVPHVTTGIGDDDWPGAFLEARARLEQNLADDAVLDTMLTFPFGTMPGAAALRMFTGELAMHGWDLVTATGQSMPLDPDLGMFAFAAAREGIPAEPRGGDMPFAPVVSVSDDADVYDQLAGWLGRDPAFTAG